MAVFAVLLSPWAHSSWDALPLIAAVVPMVSGHLVAVDLEQRVLEPRGLVSWLVNTRRVKFSQLAVMRVRVGGSRPEDESEPENYFVEALGAEGTCRVAQTGEYLKARQAAEFFAKHVGLGIVDEGIGDFREADTLEEPLRDRIRRRGPLSPLPAAPPGLLVKVAGEELCVEQSQTGTRCFCSMERVGFLIYVQLLICYVAWFIRGTPGSPSSFLIVGLMLVGVGAALAIETMKRRKRTVVHTSVRVGPAGLKITIQEGRRARLAELSAGALDGVGVGEDPECSPTHPLRILAVTCHRAVSFGAGWPPVQQQWLVLAIHHALSADTITVPVRVDAQ